MGMMDVLNTIRTHTAELALYVERGAALLVEVLDPSIEAQADPFAAAAETIKSLRAELAGTKESLSVATALSGGTDLRSSLVDLARAAVASATPDDLKRSKFLRSVGWIQNPDSVWIDPTTGSGFPQISVAVNQARSYAIKPFLNILDQPQLQPITSFMQVANGNVGMSQGGEQTTTADGNIGMQRGVA